MRIVNIVNMPSRVCFLLVALLFDGMSAVFARHYEPCELARELITVHKFSRKKMADWICLIEAESQFDTRANNLINWDGSSDFG